LTFHELTANPLFGVAVTVIAYALAQRIHAKYRALHPLFLTTGSIIALLLLTGIPYADYQVGGGIITFFLGPATVALGVPLYKQAQQMKSRLPAIAAGVTVGSVSGIASAALFVTLLGGSRELLLAMLPKSSTSPIAIEIVRQIGGIPELGGVMAVLTGLLGSMVGPELLRLAGVRGDIPIGVAIGTSAHGIGTARVLRESELQGGVSGFAMSIAGLVTSLAAIPLYYWLQ